MRYYEIMIILDPEMDERITNVTLEKLLQVVSNNGGAANKVDIWGKHRLAYDIKEKSGGFYVAMDTTTMSEVAQELDRQLGLNEAVLRAKLLRPEARASTGDGDNAMAGGVIAIIIGNLTTDPGMRLMPSGVAVTSFTVASTPCTFDRQVGERKDGEALFVCCSTWRDAAENVVESPTKDIRIIAQDRLVQRSYITREGENRTVVEIQVNEIGPSLRYTKAQVIRQPCGGGQGGFDGGQGGPQGGGLGGNQGGQGGYNQGGPQWGGYNGGGGFGGQGQSRYDAPAGGAADDPWAMGGSTFFGDEPLF